MAVSLESARVAVPSPKDAGGAGVSFGKCKKASADANLDGWISHLLKFGATDDISSLSFVVIHALLIELSFLALFT